MSGIIKSFKQFLNEFELEGAHQEKLPISPFSTEDIQKVKEIIQDIESKNYKKISDFINLKAIEYDYNRDEYDDNFYMDSNEIVTPNGNAVEFDHGELNIKDNYKTNGGDVSLLITLYNNCLFKLLFQGGIPYEMSLISRITSDIGSRYEFNTLYLSYGEFTNENYHNKLELNMVNNKVPVFHSVEEFQKYMNEYNEYLGIIYPELKKSIQKIMGNYRV